MLLKFPLKVHENETKKIFTFAENATLAPNIPLFKTSPIPSPTKMSGETTNLQALV